MLRARDGSRVTVWDQTRPYAAAPLLGTVDGTFRLTVFNLRLRRGDQVRWRFTGTLDQPVRGFEERLRARPGAC